MRFLPLLTLTLGVSSLSGLALTPSALSQQLPYPENSTFFTGEPPSLVSADTPDSSVGWPEPHYYFTLNLPASSKESLAKITIAPEMSGDPISFNLSKTQAFQGTSKSKGEDLTLQSVTQDKDTQLINVVFASPVPPGTTFTVVLQPFNNPWESGTYLFTVQAFPAAENPIGIDLGVGRFTFYRRF
ncbi:conserved hypothetical protein [Gloeothece citriformis PCC 7424]|uniref:DUF2808 domain-containing protein n=1 Tax=Gloeothece citriformis (strain PCC 7424) TaxID=65393 RepID=B7KJD5_GLOC7|nr:DUF2808 domain-containing protein [Gloeothece citriformis]ACK72219.1 conserved hypothetical protein [Gloeothece citriformis PCC 7424]